MMKKTKDIKWADLSDPVGTILERVDINGRSVDIEIGSEVNIPYFKGVFTAEMAQEIMDYQHSKDNAEGHFSATLEDNVLKIKFLKRAF
jgi:hypothetical protein